MITRIDTNKEHGNWDTFFNTINKLAKDNNVTNDKGKLVEVSSISDYFENITGIVKMAATNPFVIRVPVDEQIIDIDANTRRIKLGNDFGKTVFLNVAKDHMAETIWFRIDRYFDI